MSKRRIYKVVFHNQGKVYEIYARGVHQSGMYGFVEVDRLVFGARTSVVLDPSDEYLKSEFSGVSKTYLPMHSIIRIDEVEKEGQGKVTTLGKEGSNVTPFPIYTQTDTNKS